jgi:glucose-1-phosphate thymidylyltransferase
MKGIILAGGSGSRLYPLTKVTNKHLLPVGRKPMIFHIVEKMTNAGINDILIVTGIGHMGDIVDLLGSGKNYGCSFTYKVQDEAGGIAQALSLAEEYVHNEKICVILGDNIFQNGISDSVKLFEEQENGARVLIKEVKDPKRFGVADILDGKILGIEEKPDKPKSNYAVLGIYFYDKYVFEYIKMLRMSDRKELEVTDLNNIYIERGELEYSVLDGWWTDAGTFESLKNANNLVGDE